jgi:hypothetical protein
MSTIAKTPRGTGDPAVAFKERVLNILDPFLCSTSATARTA